MLLGFGLSAAAFAQSTANALVTGGWAETGAQGFDERATFSCRGSPTCTGQFSVTVRLENCSNYTNYGGDFTITGFNLAQSGPIGGILTFRAPNVDAAVVRNPNGTCDFPNPPVVTESFNYTGNYSLATGTGTAAINFGGGDTLAFNFRADTTVPAPVFPLTVTSNINATSASATAAFQYRPQDVGKSGSVYVFAVAPSAQVKGAADGKAVVVGKAVGGGDVPGGGKADPPLCVLAQLSTTGQLVAVTYAQLQASLSGTLSAQGASVTILNNVSTPTVAGATFYVGYGASSVAMIDEGVYRSAVTVPGTGVCPMPSSQTALWWNSAEPGWGANLNHQGNILFGTLFTYDAAGVPLWLVMSAGAIQSDGASFTGDLYRTTGPAFNANPFTPIGAGNLTKVGTMTASFIDVNGGTLRYTVNGTEVTKAITRQVFGTRAASCMPTTASRAAATNYQDLWWNAAESGWGINVTHQDNTLFATLFTYDASGRDLWLVMSAGTRQADGSYSGDLYRTKGPPFNANPFTPIGAGDVTTVGTMRFRFTDGLNGTVTYTYNGAPVTKSITRQLFSSPVPACS